MTLLQNERKIAERQAWTINAIKGKISQDFVEGIFEIDKVVLSRCHEAYRSLTKALQENYYPGIIVVYRPDELLPKRWIQAENLIQLGGDVQTYAQRMETFQRKAVELKKRYGVISAAGEQLTSNVDQLATLDALEAELQKLRAIIDGNSAMSAIDAEKLMEACRKELVGAQPKADTIHSTQSELLLDFEKNILDADYQEMLAQYKLKYTSILKYMRRSYYADRRQMKLLYRNVSQKIDDKTIIEALTRLQDIGKAREDMGCECQNLIVAFWDEDTDFQNISMLLDAYANILEAIRLVSDMMEIVQGFESSDSELAEKYGVWYRGMDTSWERVLHALQKTADFRQKIRNEVTAFQPYYKSDAEEISERVVIKALLALSQLEAERDKCNVVCPRFICVFDGVFEYENTDFKRVDALLTTYDAFIRANAILVDMDGMIQELNLREADLREQYGFFYKGVATSWQDIRDALDWTTEFKKEIDKYQPNDEFIKRICSGGEITKQCGTHQDDWEKLKQAEEHLHPCRMACFDGELSKADYIMEIVKCLYPIHYESICEEIAPLFGCLTAAARVKLAVDPLLQQLGNKLIRKGDFCFPAGYTKITPRYNVRKIKHVSSEELAEVMCDILGRYDVLRSVGLTKEFLYDETALEYHFFRKTRNVILALNEAVGLLEKQNRIEIVDGKVILSK